MYIQPDVVHVFMNGRLVRTGGMDLVHRLEEDGYDWLADEAAVATVLAAVPFEGLDPCSDYSWEDPDEWWDKFKDKELDKRNFINKFKSLDVLIRLD